MPQISPLKVHFSVFPGRKIDLLLILVVVGGFLKDHIDQMYFTYLQTPVLPSFLVNLQRLHKLTKDGLANGLKVKK